MVSYLLVVFVAVCSCLHAADSDMSDISVVVASKKSDTESSLFRINMTSQSVDKVDVFKVVRPTAVAIDDVSARIYWSDVVTKEIRSSQLDGSDERKLVDFSTMSIVDGITIDSMERLLFYTDRGNNVIGSVTLDQPRLSSVILEEVENLPRAITAYHKKRMLFWTDWGSDAHILSCSYSGKNKKLLIEADIQWPNGLTIDQANEKLYWVDAYDGEIETANIDGSDRKVVVKSGFHYYGIAYFEGNLYTTDWDSNSVTVTASNGSELSTVTHEGFTKLSGLAVIKVPRGECSDGYYGVGCFYECGYCVDDEVCDKTDGMCPSGCQTGWFSERCNKANIAVLSSGTSSRGQLAFILFSLAATSGIAAISLHV